MYTKICLVSKDSLVFSMALLIMSGLLFFLYHVPLLNSVIFLLATFFCFYIPGSLLAEVAKIRFANSLLSEMMSLGMGFTIVPVVYLYLRRLGEPVLMIGLLSVLAVVWVALKFKTSTGNKGEESSSPAISLSSIHLVGILSFVFILLHFSHFTDVIISDSGIQMRNSPLTEAVFHQGIINSIKDTFPPPSIYASGQVDFSQYHLAMHAGIELIHRIFSIKTIYLIYFYYPLMCLFLIATIPYILFYEKLGNWKVGVIVGLLLFGSNFSFIPGVLGWGYSNYPWVFFLPDTIWSLFTLNGYMPAVLVLLLSLYFLWSYFESQKKINLVFWGLFAFVAVSFKSSMGLHLAGSAFITGVLFILSKQKRRVGIELIVTSFVVLLATYLDVQFIRGGTGDNVLEFLPFNSFRLSLTKSQIFNLNSFTYPLAFTAYVAGVFGSRLAGFYLPRKRVSTSNQSIMFLVVFCLSGFVLTEFFSLKVDGDKINNSSWFLSQSLMGGWILLGFSLIELKKSLNRKWFIVVTSLLVILALPGTFQFLYKRYTHDYFFFNNDAIDVSVYLEQLPPESIVLYPSEINGPSLSSTFAGKTSFLSPYMSFLPPKVHFKERFKVGSVFFKLNVPMAAKKHIVDRYGIDCVYAPIKYQSVLEEMPFLNLSFSNKSYVIYRVSQKSK